MVPERSLLLIAAAAASIGLHLPGNSEPDHIVTLEFYADDPELIPLIEDYFIARDKYAASSAEVKELSVQCSNRSMAPAKDREALKRTFAGAFEHNAFLKQLHIRATTATRERFQLLGQLYNDARKTPSSLTARRIRRLVAEAAAKEAAAEDQTDSYLLSGLRDAGLVPAHQQQSSARSANSNRSAFHTPCVVDSPAQTSASIIATPTSADEAAQPVRVTQQTANDTAAAPPVLARTANQPPIERSAHQPDPSDTNPCPATQRTGTHAGCTSSVTSAPTAARRTCSAPARYARG